MKKLIKLFIAIFLLVPSFTGMSHAIISAQENVNFNLQSPQAGDEILVGEAMAEQKLIAYIEGHDYEVEVDSEGNYEIPLNTPLEEDQRLTITQGNNTIETLVQTSGSERHSIELEGLFDSNGLDVEDQNETEDITSQNEPLEEDELADEKIGQPNGLSEENTDMTDSTNTEEGTQEGTDEVLAEEGSMTSIEEENSESDEEENTESAVSPRMISPYAANQGDASPSLSGFDTTDSDRITRVSTADEFLNAIGNSQIEKVILENDIILDRSRNYAMNAPDDLKIIDGSGYRLINQDSGYIDAGNNFTNIVIRNVSDFYSLNDGINEGFIRIRGIEANLHLENVTYNAESNPQAGHVSSSWESTVHFYGNVEINFNKNNGKDLFYYRGAHIHHGSEVEINSEYSSIFNQTNRRGSGLTGLKIDDHAAVNLTAQNYVVNNAIRSDTIDAKFTVGNHSIVQVTSGNGSSFRYDDNIPVNITIGSGSDASINAANNAFEIGGNGAVNNTINGSLKIDVGDLGYKYSGSGNPVNYSINGNFNLIANEGVNYSSQNLTFDIGESAYADFQTSNVAFRQTRTGSSSFNVNDGSTWIVNNSGANPAFDFSSPTTFNIDTPEQVRWSGSNRVISTNQSHEFNLIDSSMTSRNNSESDSIYSLPYEELYFTLNNDGFNVTGEVPDEETWFRETQPNMILWEFKADLAKPEVNEPIYDTLDEGTDQVTITGNGPENSSIQLYMDDALIASADTNDNGDFEIVLNERLAVNDLLRFRAVRGAAVSVDTEVEVQGNRLEFLSVPDLSFGPVEINDEPEKVILRSTPETAQIDIQNTRGSDSWSITAQAAGPLTSTDLNESLDESLYYVNGEERSLIENTAVQVGSSQEATTVDDSTYQQRVTWNQNEGILVIMNPIYARTNTSYSTEITWTLTDAPQ